MRRLPALGATLATTAFALGAAARAPAIPPLSESVRTELVQVEVWALDGNGRAVRDLRIEEIELFVDGVRHPAVAFDPVSAADASDRAAVGPGPPGAAPPGIAWPRRMMLFFNDVLSMPEHMTAARRAAAAFLRDAGHEGDLYALASYSQRSHLRVALDFTSRRERALTAVEATLGDTARVSELMLAVSAPPPDGADPSRPISNAERARQVANEQETLNFQIQAAGHGVRDAFGALIDLLAPYPGHKAIVFFGDGLRGLTRQEVERLARDAAAAGVTIHAANTEGLTLGSPPRQQALIALADETGGVRTVSNDVGAVLRAAGAAMDGGYVLSFAPTGAADGTGHPLRLVCRRRGVTLRHRQEFRRPLPSEARERELQASFVAPDLRAGFGLEIVAVASGAGDLVLFVPSGRLLYLPGPSGRAARFEVGVVAQDEDGREIARLSRRLELRQEGDDPRGPARRSLNLRLNGTLPAATQVATAVLSDLQSGEIGAARWVRPGETTAAATQAAELMLVDPRHIALWMLLKQADTATSVSRANAPEVRTRFAPDETPICRFRIVPGAGDAGDLRLAVLGPDSVVQLQAIAPDDITHRNSQELTFEVRLPLAALGPGEFTVRLERVAPGGPVTLGQTDLVVEAAQGAL